MTFLPCSLRSKSVVLNLKVAKKDNFINTFQSDLLMEELWIEQLREAIREKRTYKKGTIFLLDEHTLAKGTGVREGRSEEFETVRVLY